MAENTITTIDEYIATFPDNVQAILQKIRATIQAAAPQATEDMSYDIPTFKVDGTYLVYFAGWKHHISMYPIPAGDAAFQRRIGKYKKAKGTLQFPLNESIPYALITTIVETAVKARSASQSS